MHAELELVKSLKEYRGIFDGTITVTVLRNMARGFLAGKKISSNKP
jgi:hypothetical protein